LLRRSPTTEPNLHSRRAATAAGLSPHKSNTNLFAAAVGVFYVCDDQECRRSRLPGGIQRQFLPLSSDSASTNRQRRRCVIALDGSQTRTWVRAAVTLRRGIYWPQQHNDVIQKILRKSRKGTHVIYIPGNHDELVTDFCGAYGNIEIKQRAIHVTASGERILVIHGHELDAVVQNVKWLAFAGDLGYQFLLSLNPLINFVRRRFGLGYWSLSAYAKQRVKDAVSFIGRFEEEIVHYAKKFSVDAVLCGHIHSAAVRQFGGVTYYNCGDWVETCSALIEREDGVVEMVNYHPFSAALTASVTSSSRELTVGSP
jgi:UDP-2,3-diacylglucosamine pyrophosphatase LpxH